MSKAGDRSRRDAATARTFGPASESPQASVKLVASLVPQLPAFLSRQGWRFHEEQPRAGGATMRSEDRSPQQSQPSATSANVLHIEVLLPGRPGLLAASFTMDGVVHQLLLGLRRPGRGLIKVLGGSGDAVVGVVEDDAGEAVAYDALVDPVLCRQILKVACDPVVLRAHGLELDGDQAGSNQEIKVRLARTRGSSVVVFDEKVMLKVYHRLSGGSHRDAEMIVALDRVGFNHIAAPVAVWRIDGVDRGIVQESSGLGTEGLALAVTSLRDLYDSKCAPGGAGGDFAAESERLGVMTGRMHVALADAFGASAGAPAEWASSIERAMRSASSRGSRSVKRRSAAELLDRLRAVERPGMSIRVHGAYSLGNVARTEVGWLVSELEPLDGEPQWSARAGGGESAGRRYGSSGGMPSPVSSPIYDVATMFRSFAAVARAAADEHDPSGWADLAPFARAWRSRNSRAFLAGYMSASGVEGLLPAERDVFDLVLRAMMLA